MTVESWVTGLQLSSIETVQLLVSVVMMVYVSMVVFWLFWTEMILEVSRGLVVSLLMILMMEPVTAVLSSKSSAGMGVEMIGLGLMTSMAGITCESTLIDCLFSSVMYLLKMQLDPCSFLEMMETVVVWLAGSTMYDWMLAGVRVGFWLMKRSTAADA